MKKIVRFHDSIICQNFQDYEQYAFFYSKSLAEEVYHDEDIPIGSYVSIKYGSKVIYRKCAAWRTIGSEELSLGNRSIKELGLSRAQLGVEKVQVNKSNWFAYNFYNSDTSLKMLFYMAILGFFCSVFSTLKDLLELL